jgi:hypothetical protein
MENIRKLVLLAMIFGIIPLAFVHIGIAAINNIDSATTIATQKDFLYIGDASDNTVKRFYANSGNFTDNFVTNGSGGLHGPRGLLFDGNGNLLVSNQNVNLPITGEILRYNGTTGAFQGALIPNTSKNAPFAPRGIVLNGFNLYIADLLGPNLQHGNVKTYDVNNGNFLGDLNGFPNTDFYPNAVVFGPDGNLYVSVRNIPSSLGGRVFRFKPDGSFDKIFIADKGGIGNLHLNSPGGLVFGPDGNLYITSGRADPNNSDPISLNDTDSIRIYSANGQFLRKIELDPTVGQPRAHAIALVFGPRGSLFVPIMETGEVRQYNADTGKYKSFIPAGGELGNPWFLIFGKTNSKTLAYQG